MVIFYQNEFAFPTQYDGYFATSSGKIISIKTKGKQGKIDINSAHELSYKVDKDGYLEVCLSIMINNKQKRLYRRVHRIIYETFWGSFDSTLTIDHIDRNKTNNDLLNLRLLTREENSSIANKNKPSPKRNKYSLYKNNEFIGIFDTIQLMDYLHITKKDLYRNTKRKRQLLQQYLWIKEESVEDTEKVS